MDERMRETLKKNKDFLKFTNQLKKDVIKRLKKADQYIFIDATQLPAPHIITVGLIPVEVLGIFDYYHERQMKEIFECSYHVTKDYLKTGVYRYNTKKDKEKECLKK